MKINLPRPVTALSLTQSLALSLLLLWPAAGFAQTPAPLDTTQQRFSYAIGLQTARQLLQQGLSGELDVNAFAQALRDSLDGTEPRLTNDQMQQAAQEMRGIVMEKRTLAATAARAAGERFLAENKTQSGVTATASGLQYKVTKAGSGAHPAPSDQVRVHYEGRLLNGKVFDSSYKRGEPAVFGVGQVIPGWQEALQLMSPGATWEIWLPSAIAYGEQGAGGDIGPNEVLHFTVELIEIVR